jgi:hypothetical protein
MKLNVLDRVIGIQALAEHSKFDFATYKTLEGLRHKLLINEEEVKKYNFRTENNSYKWDPSGTIEYVDFDFSEMEITLLREGLIAIDKRKELTENHIPLFKKVLPDTE